MNVPQHNKVYIQRTYSLRPTKGRETNSDDKLWPSGHLEEDLHCVAQVCHVVTAPGGREAFIMSPC